MTGPNAPRVFGVIPAAGHSARLGRPKQLLPLGGKTLLQVVVDKVLAGSVDGLVVVVSPAVDAALHLAVDVRHLTAIQRDANAEMLDSIKLGIDRLSVRHLTTPRDAFLVCPGDLPALSSELVAECAADYRAHPGTIVIGACGARLGHPLVAPFGLRGELDKLAGVGLRGLLHTFASQVRRVEATSGAQFDDIDTPADYAARQEDGNRTAKTGE